MDTIMTVLRRISSRERCPGTVDLVRRVHRLRFESLTAAVIQFALTPSWSINHSLGRTLGPSVYRLRLRTWNMDSALSHCGPFIRSHGRTPRRNGSADVPVGLRQAQAGRSLAVARLMETTQPAHRDLIQSSTSRSRLTATTATP